jgi:predicted nucleotide-binding protein
VPYHIQIQTDAEGYGQVIVVDKDRGWIEERIAAPRRQGTAMFINGSVLSWESISEIHIFETDKTSQEVILAYREAGYGFNWSYNFRNLLSTEIDVGGHDVTDEFLTGLPGTGLGSNIGPAITFAADRTTVMVIYGHDTEANTALFDWLRAIGLRPREWGQLVHASGSTSPYIGHVLEEAFRSAQAVIAYFTPDEHVIARTPPPEDRFTPPKSENPWRLQARPNVLFEAGMALVTHPERTVLAVLGDQELPSDLAGRHYIRLSHTRPQPLNDLATRLQHAGCDIDLSGSDWLNAARFPDRSRIPPKPALRPKPGPGRAPTLGSQRRPEVPPDGIQ